MLQFLTDAAAKARGPRRPVRWHRSRPLTVEWLEERTLLSVTPVSSEFRVNTTVDGFQGLGDVAMAADGRFVAVWSGLTPDGGRETVYGQRYTPAGRPHGREFQVSTTATIDLQRSPRVVMNASGGFAVAWHRSTTQFRGTDVYARLYTAAGVPRGWEFLVNPMPGRADAASVAIADNGNVVVAWRDDRGADPDFDIPDFEIFARLYTARGLPRGPAFQVNTITAVHQQAPEVAMDADGDFVVTWMGGSQGASISARRYTAAGVPQGTEFRVSPVTSLSEQLPSVAMTPTGEFVVTWETCTEDNCDVYAQLSTATGVSRGSAILVSSTQPHRAGSTVAIDARGNFIVTWEICNERGEETGCTDFDVYARRYTAAGVPDGLEFRVNDTTDGFQWSPSVAVNAGGNFVIMWEGRGPGDSSGVFARRYTATPVPRTFVFSFLGFCGQVGEDPPSGM